MSGVYSFQIPLLQTARLTLRAIRPEDHPQLMALAHDPDVAEFMHEGPPPSESDVWNRMANALGQWALRGYGMMALEDRDGFVGRVGFFHPYGIREPLFVYAIAKRGWGKGYATESARAALNWLFEMRQLQRVTAYIDPQNVSSTRVAQKLGAMPNGTTSWAGAIVDVWTFERGEAPQRSKATPTRKTMP
ncbi:GNAT family N-acetyltransferase [Bosea vaviloviae]|uniref:N-acetyltransferase domain-containing protein n=1 Tax=Bosea vaviloviae TaxID=1526658 RepID=A0A1D7U6D8_9HYPH|nr:GNAT family N-acetyltransferase [Bosea vaviloviae]AOO82904.1 hypothetical protein BHK69_22895 [Bosea vaviloviae]